MKKSISGDQYNHNVTEDNMVFLIFRQYYGHVVFYTAITDCPFIADGGEGD